MNLIGSREYYLNISLNVMQTCSKLQVLHHAAICSAKEIFSYDTTTKHQINESNRHIIQTLMNDLTLMDEDGLSFHIGTSFIFILECCSSFVVVENKFQSIKCPLTIRMKNYDDEVLYLW